MRRFADHLQTFAELLCEDVGNLIDLICPGESLLENQSWSACQGDIAEQCVKTHNRRQYLKSHHVITWNIYQEAKKAKCIGNKCVPVVKMIATLP